MRFVFLSLLNLSFNLVYRNVDKLKYKFLLDIKDCKCWRERIVGGFKYYIIWLFYFIDDKGI